MKKDESQNRIIKNTKKSFLFFDQSPYSNIQNIPICTPLKKIKSISSNTSNHTVLLKSFTSNSLLEIKKQRLNIPGYAYPIKKIPCEKKLEKLFEEDLRTAKKPDNFGIYEKYFSEVIRFDTKYANILKKIKAAYDEKSSFLGVDELKAEIKTLKDKIEEYATENKNLLKSLEKSFKDIEEISKNLEETESLYIEVHEKLHNIYDIDITSFPQTENHWKSILLENKQLAKLCEKVTRENKKLSETEQKYSRLISELANKGYPVEEVYNSISKNCKGSGRSGQETGTDTELLVSGRPKETKKPSIVPVLHFSLVQDDSQNKSSSSSN